MNEIPTIELDSDGYPTPESLERVRQVVANLNSWQLAKAAFYAALAVNRYFGACGRTYVEVRGETIAVWEYHTYGWSGNEEIIAMLKNANPALWGAFLQRYDAGGHYYFTAP